MAAVHFPYAEDSVCGSSEQTRNPEVCDVELSDTVLQLALLLEAVFVMHGLGFALEPFPEIGKLEIGAIP